MNNKVDLAELRENARSYSGYDLVSEQALLEIYDAAASIDIIIQGIEPFLLKDGLEHPQVHLTITPYEIHNDYKSLSWKERIVAMKVEIERLLEETHRIGGEFRFNLYLASEDQWA